MKGLQLGLEALKKYASDSKVFVLIHQCDRIEQEKRERVILLGERREVNIFEDDREM